MLTPRGEEGGEARRSAKPGAETLSLLERMWRISHAKRMAAVRKARQLAEVRATDNPAAVDPPSEPR